MTPSKTLFLSHSSQDRKFIHELSELIKTAAPDLDLFNSSDEAAGNEGGTPVTDGHHDRIRDAVASVLVITPASLDSSWCAQEWGICQYAHQKCFPLIAPGLSAPPGFLGRDLAKTIERPQLNGFVEWLQKLSEEPCTDTVKISDAVERVIDARDSLARSEMQRLVAEVREVVKLIPTLDSLHAAQKRLSEQLGELRQMVDSRDRAIDLSNSLKQITALSASNPIVLAGAGVSQELADRLTPVIEKVMTLDKLNKDSVAEFKDDYSTVLGLLQQLAAGLPLNSVWLGVSLLTGDGAWAPGPKQLQDFQASLEKKTENETLSVRRLYVTRASGSLGKTLDSHIKRVRKKNVDVRVLRLGEGEVAPADISLLWTPPADKQVTGLQRVTSDVVSELQRLGFSLAAALEFQVSGNESLDGVKIYASNHQQLGGLSREFEANWERADCYELPS